MNVVLEVVVEAIASVLDFLTNNLNNIATLLNVSLIFAMYYLGYISYGYGIETILPTAFGIPVIIGMIIYILRNTANKIGKGTTLPIPKYRFTEVDDYGEASVEVERIQELILYTADLEDWIERKHLK